MAWNETARDLLAARGIGSFVQARVLAYLSVAQYNAIVAEDANGRGEHPSPAAAAGDGPGSWTGVNAGLGGYGARLFALTSGDQFRPPPPVFDSPAFTAALHEVRALSDGLTPTQIAFAPFWGRPRPKLEPAGRTTRYHCARNPKCTGRYQ